jgi:hypothetical protein
MPDLDLIKQAEQGVRDARRRFLRVEMANDTPTLTLPRLRGREGRGLAAYFYSRDIGRIWRVAEALEYGIVGINEGIISSKSHWRDRALRQHEGKWHRPNPAGCRGSKYGIEEFLEVNEIGRAGQGRRILRFAEMPLSDPTPAKLSPRSIQARRARRRAAVPLRPRRTRRAAAALRQCR